MNQTIARVVEYHHAVVTHKTSTNTRIIYLKLQLPNIGSYKLNIDGVACTNSGKRDVGGEGGGRFRNSRGEWVLGT